MSAHGIRRIFMAVALLALPAMVATPGAQAEDDVLRFETPQPVPLLSPSYGQDWGAVVSVTEHDAVPRRVEIIEGEKLAWQSQAAVGLHIVLDADVARSMRCTEVVNFSLEGGHLRSELLRTGDVASLCELAPGRYVYRVEKDPHIATSQPLSERARGEIVVHPRPTASADEPRTAGLAARSR